MTHIVPKRQTHKKIKKQSILRATVVLAAILTITVVVLLLRHFAAPPNLEKAEGIRDVLSRHMIVPDESPVIATVTDKSALKTPFLRESENGDKIIIYEKAKKVVIYRPSLDRIVNIGPVDLNNIPKARM